MTSVRTSVLVVGGGPVGLATAMELDHHGVSCVVVEPREQVSHLRPRAKTTSARTMELFRRWGLAATIRQRAPLQMDWSKDIVFCTTVTGREVTRLTGTLGLALAGSDVAAEHGHRSRSRSSSRRCVTRWSAPPTRRCCWDGGRSRSTSGLARC